ncbi:MAG: SLBB domain-containing protein [Clostridia bacterium]|nr:SLBB domain-containing protein [Clostridia bacterium]
MNKTRRLISEYFDKYTVTEIDKYIDLGGFSGLKKALKEGPDFVIDSIQKAELRGRGGAAFPCFKKWTSAKNRPEPVKYVLVNADEGEPGTFKDRDLLAKDPYRIIEGLIIAGYTTGAKEGYIYIREEYDDIRRQMNEAIALAKSRNFLGNNILGTDFSFSIKAYTGAGAYVCGENTALIESMHGNVGRPRVKTPRVGERGLFDKPTMVNNVETYACVAAIMNHGWEAYANQGLNGHKGTKMISLCGNIMRPGVYEVPFGITVKEIIEEIGGGTRDLSLGKFIQSGGASCALIPYTHFDTPYTYDDFKKKGFDIGSGSIVVANGNVRVVDYLSSVSGFFEHESCGKCTPCREGTKRMHEIIDDLCLNRASDQQVNRLFEIADSMMDSSLCGLGQTAPTATLSAFKHFKEEIMESVTK